LELECLSQRELLEHFLANGEGDGMDDRRAAADTADRK